MSMFGPTSSWDELINCEFAAQDLAWARRPALLLRTTERVTAPGSVAEILTSLQSPADRRLCLLGGYSYAPSKRLLRSRHHPVETTANDFDREAHPDRSTAIPHGPGQARSKAD